ncbi:hypothetical protein GCM10029963_67630 [Micromonospora andamanensis]
MRWVRELFRRLATEGRTVFVSSHLMGEVEHCADHLVVIGRGRLIADETLDAFAARVGRAEVVVRTPEPAMLTTALADAGASVRPDPDGALTVAGVGAERIAELALGLRIPLHQLTPAPPRWRRPSWRSPPPMSSTPPGRADERRDPNRPHRSGALS